MRLRKICVNYADKKRFIMSDLGVYLHTLFVSYTILVRLSNFCKILKRSSLQSQSSEFYWVGSQLEMKPNTL
jgi:hypothetical protein